MTGDLAGLRIAQLLESDGPGGAETVVVHLARSLRARGAELFVFVPRNGQGWLREQLENDDVQFVEFQFQRALSPQFASWLTSTFREHRLDVVHSHEFSFAVYGAWAARRSASAHIITMHGGRYYAERIRRRAALRMAIGVSDSTVAVSQPLHDHLCRDLKLDPARVRVLPNGIPAPSGVGTGVPAALGLPNDARLVLSVGNLYPVKGHRHLIAAFQRIAGKHLHTYLAIAGRGELLDELQRQAAELGVADRVKFLGLRSDVPALLAASDLFVLPSLSEGLPIAILEAMFAGKPILASDVGGIRAALADGTAGVVVPPGDEAGLARELDRLLSDAPAAQAMGERARAHAQREFDVGVMVSRYVELYREALRKRSSSKPSAAP